MHGLVYNISEVRKDDFFPYRFCGFESDVVVIKRQFHNINLSGRFVFKSFFPAFKSMSFRVTEKFY